MMKSSSQQGVANREAFGAIIAERLELEEDWYPLDGFSYFSGKIRTPKYFEAAFRLMLDFGCRWDVLLTCLARTLTYNLEKVQQQPKTLSAKREPPPLPRYATKIMPLAAEERKRLRAHLQAASNALNRYDTLLFELSAYMPFRGTGLGSGITSVEACVLLPGLLRWSERLLTEQSLGNARTIERVGELVPCVYIELLASKQKTRSAREILPWLGAVAKILNELMGETAPPSGSTKKKPSKPLILSDGQLAEALRRFKRDYPGVHSQLRRKLTTLHDEPRPALGDWHQAYVRDIAGQRPRRS